MIELGLCLYCGRVKLRAQAPCHSCGSRGSGSTSIDLKFSTLKISPVTQDELGEIIQKIYDVCQDDQERYDTFFYLVSYSEPEFLQTSLTINERRMAKALLKQAGIDIDQVRLKPRPDLFKDVYLYEQFPPHSRAWYVQKINRFFTKREVPEPLNQLWMWWYDKEKKQRESRAISRLKQRNDRKKL